MGTGNLEQWIRLRPEVGIIIYRSKSQKEKGGLRGTPSKAPCARGLSLRDNEERGVSRIRRMPLRIHGCVMQLRNMRATAKQKGCDRGKSDKSSARLSF